MLGVFGSHYPTQCWVSSGHITLPNADCHLITLHYPIVVSPNQITLPNSGCLQIILPFPLLGVSWTDYPTQCRLSPEHITPPNTLSHLPSDRWIRCSIRGIVQMENRCQAAPTSPTTTASCSFQTSNCHMPDGISAQWADSSDSGPKKNCSWPWKV